MKQPIYSLRRESDGKGAEGIFSHSVLNIEGEENQITEGGPIVGEFLVVGMGLNTYWMTTEVTEITQQEEDFAFFKTKNSEYIWRKPKYDE